MRRRRAGREASALGRLPVATYRVRVRPGGHRWQGTLHVTPPSQYSEPPRLTGGNTPGRDTEARRANQTGTSGGPVGPPQYSGPPVDRLVTVTRTRLPVRAWRRARVRSGSPYASATPWRRRSSSSRPLDSARVADMSRTVCRLSSRVILSNAVLRR